MQPHVDAGMLFEELDKGKVGIFVRLFEYVAKIAAGLMSMNQQDEVKFFGHGNHLSPEYDTVQCRFVETRTPIQETGTRSTPRQIDMHRGL